MVPADPNISVGALKSRWKINLDDLITKNKSNFIKSTFKIKLSDNIRLIGILQIASETAKTEYD